MTAIVSPDRIAQVLGLRRKVRSISDLSDAVRAGLPKASLDTSLARVFANGPERTALLYRVIPEATYKRRRDYLKPEESERTERIARVIATAEYVWDDADDARRFLTTAHSELGGERPIELALTELGARRVEELLWKLFHGIAA